MAEAEIMHRTKQGPQDRRQRHATQPRLTTLAGLTMLAAPAVLTFEVSWGSCVTM